MQVYIESKIKVGDRSQIRRADFTPDRGTATIVLTMTNENEEAEDRYDNFVEFPASLAGVICLGILALAEEMS